MSCATSCHSEKDECRQSSVECDTNYEGDNVLKYKEINIIICLRGW